MIEETTSFSKIQKPIISHETERDKTILTFSGQWRSLNIADKEVEIESFFTSPKHQNINIHFSSTFISDTAGSLLIGRFLYALEKENFKLSGQIPHGISMYQTAPLQKEITLNDSEKNQWISLLGERAITYWQLSISLLTFLGEIIDHAYMNFKKRQSPRWTSIIYHLDVVGFQALPIIALISILIGAVLAYQGINQLTRFGAAIYTVDFLAISLLREIAVLITSIVIAGRSGSSFTAQIGTMVLNQEVDAIRMLGLDPLRILIIPRIIATCIALPLLVIFAMVMGAFGGMIICQIMIDLAPNQFLDSFRQSISSTTFWVGFGKAPLFALIISIIGCYRGFQVKGSAESVGVMTTKSVVESIFLIIVSDALISIFYSMLGI